MMQKRAKKGGEKGANGSWYEGGRFIATTEQPKKFGSSSHNAKREIEPYKWQILEKGEIPIYPQLSGVEIFDRETMRFEFNPNLGGNFSNPIAIEERKNLIALFNNGTRILKTT